MNKLIGNAVIGQSGGPTAAINATLAGVIDGVRLGLDDGRIKTLYGMKNGVEGLLREDLIDLGGIFFTNDGESLIKQLAHTPAAALGSCRKKLPAPNSPEAEETFSKLLEIFKKYDIRYFFYIGGNDSMDTVAKLSAYTAKHDYRMCIMGIPKTIDNDLIVTDHTPGFGCAAKFIGVTIQEIIKDCAVYTKDAVTVVEIMGRDAGWLTAASALGRHTTGLEPDLVYLPEVNFSLEDFFRDVRAALKKHPNVVVAVSEGLHFADGKYLCEGIGEPKLDAFGHKQLSGTGKALEEAIKAEIGCKVRSIELNLPQRCASHIASKTDIEESLELGRSTVRTAQRELVDVMMTIVRASESPYRAEFSHSNVSDIANRVKSVPRSFINDAANNVSDECIAYIAPLVVGEAYPEYKDGLPVYFSF